MDLTVKDDVVLRFLGLLDSNNGDILLSLEKSGLRYSQHLELMKDEGYKEAVEFMNQKRVLLAERTVVNNAVNGDQRAAEYILNNQGKQRGWGQNAVQFVPFKIDLNLYDTSENGEIIEGEIV